MFKKNNDNLKYIAIVLAIVLFHLNYANANDDNELGHDGRRYHNVNYLYSFAIPMGLSCIGNQAPAPNHGCNIYLSSDKNSYIWITGDYNSAESISTSDELLRRIDNLIKGGAEIIVLQRAKFILSDLQWERIAVSFREIDKGETTEPIVKDIAIAFRRIDGYGDVIYTIGLITNGSRYKADKNVMESIIKSWATSK